jgi:hypothetical protein
VLVHRSVSLLTSPEMFDTPMHLSANLSIDMDPENDELSAYPLIAPSHSEGEVIQAPSTHVPLWTTSREMVRGAKFDDSNVPVHVPAIFTGAGAGLGEDGGEDEGVEEPLPPQPRAKAAPISTHGRANETMEPFVIASCLDVASDIYSLPQFKTPRRHSCLPAVRARRDTV